MVEQYILEKEILPGNALNKVVLAKELLDRLVLRFRGEIQNELGDLNKKNYAFYHSTGREGMYGYRSFEWDYSKNDTTWPSPN